MHSKFLKFVLNVNKHSSNTAVRGELGRFPISAKALALSIKYWHNIVTKISPNILLISAMSAEHHSASSWLQDIEYVLKMTGFNDIWQNAHHISSNQLYMSLKRRLHDQYMQTWFDTISKHSIHVELKYMKSIYGRSPYLSIIKSPNIRSVFTKLRINNSILKSSCRNKIESELICPACNKCVIESTKHFLLECSRYANIRNVFHDKLKVLVRNYNYLSITDKMIIILDLNVEKLTKKDDIHIQEFQNIVISFVKEIYSLRKSIIN